MSNELNHQSTTTRRTDKNQRKKKSRSKLLIIIILGVLVLTLGSAYFYYLYIYNKMDVVEITQEKVELGITEENEDKINMFENNKSIINILLMGIDKREDEERGRSDSIMILSIDPVNNNIKLSSLMRDSRVSIKNHGQSKLGHAYAYGGPELALHTINDNYDLNIKYFASINYGGLINVIDSIGGIYADIKIDEIDMINTYINDTAFVEGLDYEPLERPGYQLLSGQQAVGYTRIRKVGDGDYERTMRQRIVLSGIIKELTTTSVLELPKMISKLVPNVETNINSTYMLKVGSSVINSGISNIIQARFPTDENSEGKTINGSWYLVFDEEETITELHRFIFENAIPKNHD